MGTMPTGLGEKEQGGAMSRLNRPKDPGQATHN
jgi:hypothetical protein